MGFVLGTFAKSVIVTIRRLFKVDSVTRMASVELWVVLTTLLLVFRFVLDFFGPLYAKRCMTSVVVNIEMLNYSMVHYTMGLMQLSGARVNDYFQVWAVLLVTLQYSVKIGRPYSRSKQIPLLDLMSSFWAANLLRMQTFFLLRIPLWLIWALNAARIISYFSCSEKAEAINQENMRLVTDYMSYEEEFHSSTEAAHPSKTFTMKWFKYLVLGEDPAFEQAQEDATKYKVRLNPGSGDDLVTIDKIWSVDDGERGLLGGHTDKAKKRKDVCLSFALYKLLRRRFYDLPIHEAELPGQKKLRRLVFEYIAESHERAFRVIALELSFLQDLFYSKHAAMFAGGFPVTSLLLSLSLAAATGYIAYPIRQIPERMDPTDRNRITHGVLITRVIVAFIVGKELAEIYMYVFSQWTKVLILCSYTKRRCCRHPLVKMAMRLVLCMMIRGRWNEKIRQFNLLISPRAVKVAGCTLYFPSKSPTAIKLEECTKKAILESFKGLQLNPEKLGSYFSGAFGSKEGLEERLKLAVELEADTHRILVWHIATSLCEIRLSSCKAKMLKPFFLKPRPFVKKPKVTPESEAEAEALWEHYTTAASLSNYCAYLVSQTLVPDNGIVTKKVFEEVVREIRHVTLDGRIQSLHRFRSMRDVYNRLTGITVDEKPTDQGRNIIVDEKPSDQGESVQVSDQAPTDRDEEAPEEDPTTGKKEVPKKKDRYDIKNSLTLKGAKLAEELLEAYGEDRVGLWKDLSKFWTGFLLHLAAETRASKHRTNLGGSRELVTLLWALLSHAGFLGGVSHGEQLLDQDEVQDLDQGN